VAEGLPPRLPVVFYSDSSLIGGAEVVLGILLGALDERIEATITATDREVLEFLAARRPAARVRQLPEVRGKADLRGWLGNLLGIVAGRPRIFHANTGGAGAALHALVLATVVPGLKTVLVEHLATPADTELQRRMKRIATRRLDAHVAVGETAARAIEAVNDLPPGRVHTIHNGVPDDAISTVSRAFGDGVVLGTIGRLHRQKGYDVLLRALPLLPETRLVIVGDGPERTALQRQAAERIRFVGWQERARDFLTSFDVFVLPSRFEAFPLVIIEAMLARLPVVATRVGSVPEAVQDGVTGLLSDPDDPGALSDALRPLVMDPRLREAMGTRGRLRGLELSPAVMARAYERLYASIL
jgi:glycosyltransferase involved in cell wall biosynthesis